MANLTEAGRRQLEQAYKEYVEGLERDNQQLRDEVARLKREVDERDKNLNWLNIKYNSLATVAVNAIQFAESPDTPREIILRELNKAWKYIDSEES